MAEHHRWPLQNVSNQTEKTLGIWLTVQRVAANEGDLAPERLDALDAMSARVAVATGWRETRLSESAWTKPLAELEAWVTEHRAWPKVGATNKSEKSLGIWLTTQRKAANKGTIAPERLAALDAMSARVGLSWHPNRRRADA